METSRRTGLATKCLGQWRGLFIVDEITSPVYCQIKSIKGKKPSRVVHVERLKLYILREQEDEEDFCNLEGEDAETQRSA